MSARKRQGRIDGPMERCCNGCDAPPHPPSWVLCQKCFDALDAKFNALVAPRAHEEKGR